MMAPTFQVYLSLIAANLNPVSFLSRLNRQHFPQGLASPDRLPAQTHARGEPRSSPLPIGIFDHLSHQGPESLLGATGGSTHSISQPPAEQTHSQNCLSESSLGVRYSRAPSLSFPGSISCHLLNSAFSPPPHLNFLPHTTPSTIVTPLISISRRASSQRIGKSFL